MDKSDTFVYIRGLPIPETRQPSNTLTLLSISMLPIFSLTANYVGGSIIAGPGD